MQSLETESLLHGQPSSIPSMQQTLGGGDFKIRAAFLNSGGES
jgi:hypothetical protein